MFSFLGVMYTKGNGFDRREEVCEAVIAWTTAAVIYVSKVSRPVSAVGELPAPVVGMHGVLQVLLQDLPACQWHDTPTATSQKAEDGRLRETCF